mmetsp:Transcript_64353/g.148137  ORF Transcript_64353/g.148137 Transcript_64353/m.148137 type:complete len:218 (-) Transcript_64353:14-667(-)
MPLVDQVTSNLQLPFSTFSALPPLAVKAVGRPLEAQHPPLVEQVIQELALILPVVFAKPLHQGSQIATGYPGSGWLHILTPELPGLQLRLAREGAPTKFQAPLASHPPVHKLAMVLPPVRKAQVPLAVPLVPAPVARILPAGRHSKIPLIVPQAFFELPRIHISVGVPKLAIAMPLIVLELAIKDTPIHQDLSEPPCAYGGRRDHWLHAGPLQNRGM